jgi:hypothetical protein
MANTYLKRTGTSTSNTYTFSAWIKLGTLSSANNTYQVLFSSGNQNILGLYGGATTAGHNALYHYNNTNIWYTNNLLRDPSAWYHVVVKVSGGTVTSYINGVQTSYATSTYSLGALETTTDKTCVGCYAPSATSFFRGSMSHVHFIDGTAYDPSAFGETDTTTGEWKIKTSPSVNYGTDGFTILKDGNTITDQSSNSNDFTLGGGTLTATKDCPDNNFATLNPLSGSSSNNTLTNGNTTVETTSGWRWRPSTIAPSLGKYYVEFKPTSGGNIYTAIGVTPESNWDNIDGDVIGYGESVGYDKDGAVYKGASSQSGSWSSYTTNDIIGVAADLTNRCVYFSKNGVWQNSGDPTSGASKTGGVALSATLDNWSISTSQAGTTVACNYGNGFFGTTAITTNSNNGYAGAEGASKFNYQPPTGYSALNTKGLNE